jgi:serine/threonine protein phosphatase PrpC
VANVGDCRAILIREIRECKTVAGEVQQSSSFGVDSGAGLYKELLSSNVLFPPDIIPTMFLSKDEFYIPPTSGYYPISLSKDQKLSSHTEIDRIVIRDGGFISSSSSARLRALANAPTGFFASLLSTPTTLSNASAQNVVGLRFCGSLAVARSLGDFDMPHSMSAEPEIRHLQGLYDSKYLIYIFISF